MALSWADRAEQMVFSLGEMLGLEAAAPLALWPAGVLLLSVGLGLVLTLLLLRLHRPGAAREARAARGNPEDSAADPGRTGKPEEPRKRMRKKAGEKKLQRNGLTAEPQEELKPAELQNSDPAEPKADKTKKNKKKFKTPAKEGKSASSEHKKELEEAGAWETKVSNREKRQQRRKDKGTGDESGSPGGVEPIPNVPSPVQTIITPDEPKTPTPPTPTNKKHTSNTSGSTSATRTTTTTPKTTNTSPKTTTTTSNTTCTTSATRTTTTTTPKTTNTSPKTTTTIPKTTTTTSNTTCTTSATRTTITTPKTTNTSPKTTTTSPKTTTTTPKTTTTTSNTTCTPCATRTTTNTSPKTTTRTTSNIMPAPAAQRKEEPPVFEVPHSVLQQVSPGWEEVLNVNGSGWRDFDSSSLSSDRQDRHSTWTHDMEGSWTIVDSTNIPVSFPGLPAAVESQAVPDLSWTCQPVVDDEWSGLASGCADPDWSMPAEEWGHYEDQPLESAVGTQPPPADLQESDPEKDKDDPAAPGSGKAKKKKKKKKKLEEGGATAQVEVEGGVAKDQNTAGNILPKTVREQEGVASAGPPRAVMKAFEPSEASVRTSAAPSAQRKVEESWESPKQVKKKKARRET